MPLRRTARADLNLHLGPPRILLRANEGADMALATAATAVTQTLRALHPATLARMSMTLHIDIVPDFTPITDIGGWEHLRGKTTLSGLSWDSLSIDGVADGQLRNGAMAMAVRESSVRGDCGSFTSTHEVAHLIRFFGLTSIARLSRHYLRQRDLGEGVFPRPYSMTSLDEYFADSVCAFFNRAPEVTLESRFSRQWLAATDPDMEAMLTILFPADTAPSRTTTGRRSAVV